MPQISRELEANWQLMAEGQEPNRISPLE